MPPTTRSKNTGNNQQQESPPKASCPSGPSGNKLKRTAKNKTKKPAARSAPTKSREYKKTPDERADRIKREKASLAAVSGVVSDAKFPDGEAPDQGPWVDDPRKIYPCVICGRRFPRKYQVSSHMPKCVKRNGNPLGAHWDDAWNDRAAPANTVPEEDWGTEEDESEDTESEDQEIDDDEPPNLPPQDSLGNPSLPDNPPQSNQQPSLPSSQPAPVPATVGTPYNPNLGMTALTNEALADMLQSWKDAVRYAGWSMDHEHLGRVIQEMLNRGILEKTQTWVVNGQEVVLRWE